MSRLFRDESGAIAFEAIWVALFFSFTVSLTVYLYTLSTMTLDANWKQRLIARYHSQNEVCSPGGLSLGPVYFKSGTHSFELFECLDRIDAQSGFSPTDTFWTKMQTITNEDFYDLTRDLREHGFIENTRVAGGLVMTRGFELGEGQAANRMTLDLVAQAISDGNSAMVPRQEFWKPRGNDHWAKGHDDVVCDRFSRKSRRLFPKVFPSADTCGSGPSNPSPATPLDEPPPIMMASAANAPAADTSKLNKNSAGLRTSGTAKESLAGPEAEGTGIQAALAAVDRASWGLMQPPTGAVGSPAASAAAAEGTRVQAALSAVDNASWDLLQAPAEAATNPATGVAAAPPSGTETFKTAEIIRNPKPVFEALSSKSGGGTRVASRSLPPQADSFGALGTVPAAVPPTDLFADTKAASKAIVAQLNEPEPQGVPAICDPSRSCRLAKAYMDEHFDGTDAEMREFGEMAIEATMASEVYRKVGKPETFETKYLRSQGWERETIYFGGGDPKGYDASIECKEEEKEEDGPCSIEDRFPGPTEAILYRHTSGEARLVFRGSEGNPFSDDPDSQVDWEENYLVALSHVDNALDTAEPLLRVAALSPSPILSSSARIALATQNGVSTMQERLEPDPEWHQNTPASIAEFIAAKNPGVKFVGHSQGGRQAHIGQIATGNDAIVFNSSPLAFEENVPRDKDGNTTFVRSENDPLSGLMYRRGDRSVPGADDGHGMSGLAEHMRWAREASTCDATPLPSPAPLPVQNSPEEQFKVELRAVLEAGGIPLDVSDALSEGLTAAVEAAIESAYPDGEDLLDAAVDDFFRNISDPQNLKNMTEGFITEVKKASLSDLKDVGKGFATGVAQAGLEAGWEMLWSDMSASDNGWKRAFGALATATGQDAVNIAFAFKSGGPKAAFVSGTTRSIGRVVELGAAIKEVSDSDIVGTLEAQHKKMNSDLLKYLEALETGKWDGEDLKPRFREFLCREVAEMPFRAKEHADVMNDRLLRLSDKLGDGINAGIDAFEPVVAPVIDFGKKVTEPVLNKSKEFLSKTVDTLGAIGNSAVEKVRKHSIVEGIRERDLAKTGAGVVQELVNFALPGRPISDSGGIRQALSRLPF